jgi:hypothetical protein
MPAALSVSAAAKNSSTDMVSPTSIPLSAITVLLYQKPFPRWTPTGIEYCSLSHVACSTSPAGMTSAQPSAV